MLWCEKMRERVERVERVGGRGRGREGEREREREKKEVEGVVRLDAERDEKLRG